MNIRGNKPLMLNKMIYTEHKLAKQLKDIPVIVTSLIGAKKKWKKLPQK